MSLFKMKTIRFVISSFVFFACFTTAFAQQDSLPVLPQNAADAENDFNMILLGMRNYDGSSLYGEGECLYTFRQPGMPDADSTWKARLAFDPWHTRIDFEEGFANNTQTPSGTLVSSPSGTLEITYPKTGEPNYHFRRNLDVSENGLLDGDAKTVLDPSRDRVDPRRWFHITDGQNLPTYLKERNFHILKSEFFNGFPCYVLEARQPNQPEESFERIWVSPELGFCYLQYESRFLRQADSTDGQIKKGTPIVSRVRLSYDLHNGDIRHGGDAWFITNGIAETFWMDAAGEEHLISRATIETQNFVLNREISPDEFTAAIPKDATIQVEPLGKNLSREKFRQWYGEIHYEGVKLIKD